MNKEELTERHNLVKSETWLKIRSLLFDEIQELAGSDIEPLKLQGLILATKIVDGWEKKYQQAVIRANKEE